MPSSQVPPSSPQRALILGSTSVYRKELLGRLRIPFGTVSPEVDETPLPGESPTDLAQRLALAKARAVAQRHPAAVVIGSDQVADLNGEPLGKPGHDAARKFCGGALCSNRPVDANDCGLQLRDQQAQPRAEAGIVCT